MFLHVSVSHSVHRGCRSQGVPGSGGCLAPGGEGSAWSGGGVPGNGRGCLVPGGVPGRVCVETPPWRLLLRAVRILLECILILMLYFISVTSVNSSPSQQQQQTLYRLPTPAPGQIVNLPGTVKRPQGNNHAIVACTYIWKSTNQRLAT